MVEAVPRPIYCFTHKYHTKADKSDNDVFTLAFTRVKGFIEWVVGQFLSVPSFVCIRRDV